MVSLGHNELIYPSLKQDADEIREKNYQVYSFEGKNHLLWLILARRKINASLNWVIVMFKKQIVRCLVLHHFLNQWGLRVDWTFRNRLQWYFNQNIKYLIPESHLKMLSVLSRPFYSGYNVLINSSLWGIKNDKTWLTSFLPFHWGYKKRGNQLWHDSGQAEHMKPGTAEFA